MSDALFRKVVEVHGPDITAALLRAYCEGLEKKSVFDPCGWGFLGLFAQDFPMELREELNDRAQKQVHKPYGCVLCGDKEATKYHILAGKVCSDCFSTMPGGDQ